MIKRIILGASALYLLSGCATSTKELTANISSIQNELETYGVKFNKTTKKTNSVEGTTALSTESNIADKDSSKKTSYNRGTLPSPSIKIENSITKEYNSGYIYNGVQHTFNSGKYRFSEQPVDFDLEPLPLYAKYLNTKGLDLSNSDDEESYRQFIQANSESDYQLLKEDQFKQEGVYQKYLPVLKSYGNKLDTETIHHVTLNNVRGLKYDFKNECFIAKGFTGIPETRKSGIRINIMNDKFENNNIIKLNINKNDAESFLEYFKKSRVRIAIDYKIKAYIGQYDASKWVKYKHMYYMGKKSTEEERKEYSKALSHILLDVEILRWDLIAFNGEPVYSSDKKYVQDFNNIKWLNYKDYAEVR